MSGSVQNRGCDAEFVEAHTVGGGLRAVVHRESPAAEQWGQQCARGTNAAKPTIGSLLRERLIGSVADDGAGGSAGQFGSVAEMIGMNMGLQNEGQFIRIDTDLPAAGPNSADLPWRPRIHEHWFSNASQQVGV